METRRGIASLRGWRATAAIVACAIAVPACRMHGVDRVERTTGVTAETPATAPGLDNTALEALGLERRWDLPLRGERIDQFYLVGQSIYAFTASNTMYSIDAHSGHTDWMYDLGGPLTEPPGLYRYPEPPEGVQKPRDEVYLITRNSLHVLDTSGNLLWTMTLAFSPSTAPVGASGWIFIGGLDDRVHAISKADQFEAWAYRMTGPVSARPVLGEISGGETPEQALFVASEDGIVYSFEPGRGTPRGRYASHGPIRMDPVYHRDRIYFASEDFSAYALEIANFTTRPPEWVFPAGGLITQAIVPVREGVYVSAVRTVEGPEGTQRTPYVFALRRSSEYQEASGQVLRAGLPRWALAGGTRVIARGTDVIFILDEGSMLHAVEDETPVPAAADGSPGAPVERWVSDFVRAAEFVVTNPFDPTSFRPEEARVAGMVLTGYANGWIVAYGQRPRY